MYQTITFSDFYNEFEAHDRLEQFSFKGLRALFDYLERYEEETSHDIELDVIALCCEYNEYASLEDCLSNYDKIKTREELEDNTQVIPIEGGGIIIQNF